MSDIFPANHVAMLATLSTVPREGIQFLREKGPSDAGHAIAAIVFFFGGSTFLSVVLCPLSL
jgi:hypothetical protein